MKTIRTKVYKFNELSEQAQTKAISDHIDFILQVMNEDSYYWQFAQKMEAMQTPWFIGQYINEKARPVVIEDIQANDYDFFKDGSIYNI